MSKSKQPETQTPEVITIDDQAYTLDQLGQDAQQQLQNLRVTDQFIARIQTDLGIAQTARNAYGRVVNQNLPEPAHPNKKKDVVTIDNKNYALDDFSDAVKAELTSLQITNQRIEQLQAELAIVQTARNAYGNALKSQLPEKGVTKQ